MAGIGNKPQTEAFRQSNSIHYSDSFIYNWHENDCLVGGSEKDRT